MESRRFIRSGIAASAIGHLSVLMMVLIFSEVHPFGSVTAEPVTVDLVSPDEVVQSPKMVEPPPELKTAQPSDSFQLSSQAADSQAPDAPQPAAAQPQQQAALSMPGPIQQQTAVQPQSPSASPSPAFIPPEPDLTVKYHVILGLPQDPPPDRPGDNFDAPASQTADVASSLVTEFRRHLKTCSKLPQSIAPADKIKIKLRVFMTPDGRLAAEPVLIEASASAKGPVLMQSAMSALEGCQPYAMLPMDRYGEWKTLDLSFTPQDFSGG
ncbi:hypothetical protein [Bradyrhizobium sp. URHD0069]|uniref:hypothetical protein n=1 Tax=Bradyrhizobium sp. URHD0069 TaxID=1380355 RepID=UPI0004968019|nr:hypothetical protein [Bradyrhizobium sp. URHD0069]